MTKTDLILIMKATALILLILLPLALLFIPANEEQESAAAENVIEIVTRGDQGVIRIYNDSAEILSYEQLQRLFCRAKADLVIINNKVDELIVKPKP